jgi:hypothetical protein
MRKSKRRFTRFGMDTSFYLHAKSPRMIAYAGGMVVSVTRIPDHGVEVFFIGIGVAFDQRIFIGATSSKPSVEAWRKRYLNNEGQLIFDHIPKDRAADKLEL